MELRVLSGPRAGCRLPLGVGTYRAGADETCDVVLERLSAGETAFIIYVGQRSIGLESLSDELRLNGRTLSGLVPLAAGQVFELGPWLFAVDEVDAPWPADPESLRGRAQGEAAATGTGSHQGDEGELIDADPFAPGAGAKMSDKSPGDEVGDKRAEGNSDEQGAPQGDLPHDPQAAVPTSSADKAASALKRRKVPFWVIGLAGTAAFLACGVVVLVMSLAPAQPAAAAGTAHPAEDRLAKLVAASGDGLKLEHMAGSRTKISGTVATRDEKLKLTREARAIEPMVLLQVSADEDLASLARDALTSFPQSGVEIGKVDHGRLILTGHVSDTKVRDQIVTAMWDSVPGLTAVDSQVIAGEEVLASLNALLNDAGLAKKITGVLDPTDPTRLTVRGVLPEAERTAWADVRQKLETHFGTALTIVDDLHAPDALPPSVAPIESDIVAIVRGPMPYALLRNGTKRALPPSAK